MGIAAYLCIVLLMTSIKDQGKLAFKSRNDSAVSLGL